MTPITILLMGQMCSGKNAMQVSRDGRHYPAERFKVWRDIMLLQIKKQVPHDFKKINMPCSVAVNYTPGDLRRRDTPGIIDALCHVLERAMIVEDDCLLEDWDFVKSSLNRESPSCGLTISKK